MWTLLLAITLSGTTGSLPFSVLGIAGGFSTNLAGGDTIYCIFTRVWPLLSVTTLGPPLLDYISLLNYMVVPSVYSALVRSGVKFCFMVLLMYLNGPLVFLFVKCFDTVILHLGLEPVSFSNFNGHPLSCA